MAIQPSSLTKPGLERDTSALTPTCLSWDRTWLHLGSAQAGNLLRIFPDLRHNSHSGEARVVTIEAVPEDGDLIAGPDAEPAPVPVPPPRWRSVVPALLAGQRSAGVGAERRVHDGTKSNGAHHGEQQGRGEQRPRPGGAWKGCSKRAAAPRQISTR